jgi:hypothetical protein
MKSTLSVLFSFSLIMGAEFSLGCSNASAQSSTSQVTGHEFTRWEPEGFSDSQFSLLWNAYNLKSDSLLAKFFNNWRLETQILEEPVLNSPISDATASLFTFLLNNDFQNSYYPYEYAVIQNQVEAAVSSPSWSSDNGYVLVDFHPPSSNPQGPLYIMLDDRHNGLLGEFLGDWSVTKAQAAQQFFGSYAPFGTDVYYYDKQADWSLFRHWYSFQFTSDLLEAFVTDETPSGTVNYTCIIGPEGTWMKVSNETVIMEPVSPSEPPDPYYPPPDPRPYWPPHPPRPPHPPHGPDPVPPTGGVIIQPTPAPAPPVARPRTVPTPTHTVTPTDPVDVGRPRTNPPPEHSPVSPPFYQPVVPQSPSQPERKRTDSPPAPQQTPPQQAPVERQRTNAPQVNPPSPQPAVPQERPRTVQPAPSNPPPANPQKPAPPPEKKDQDQKRDRQR